MQILVTNNTASPRRWFIEPLPADPTVIPAGQTMTMQFGALADGLLVEVFLHDEGEVVWVGSVSEPSVPSRVLVEQDVTFEWPEDRRFPAWPDGGRNRASLREWFNQTPTLGERERPPDQE